MQIYDVTDAKFKKYGKIVENIDFSLLPDDAVDIIGNGKPGLIIQRGKGFIQ